MRKFTNLVLTLLLATFTFGVQAQGQSKLERDLEEFRSWMNHKLSQADSVTKAEWPSIKQEFQERTAGLDKNSNNMSAASKKEYGEVKNKYKTLEDQNEETYGQPLNRELARRWEMELTGVSTINSIRPVELRDTFIYFMEQVRDRRDSWTLRDWDYAEHVYLELSNRKQVVLDKMTNADKIKVAALQVEFNTLRKSRTVRDKIDNRKNN